MIFPRKSSRIRRSTDADISFIYAWLQKQAAADVPGTFLCNWNLTLDEHEKGRVLIYTDPETEGAVAYQWGGLVRPGILGVRADRRGNGIGRIMTEHRLAEASEHNEGILYIQCKPSSSITFWERMGFKLVVGSSTKNYAYRFVPKLLELPEDGVPVSVRIELYPERRKWTLTELPISVHTPAAARNKDQVICLAERVYAFDGGYDKFNTVRDLVVRVVVDGQDVYFDKLKYEEALNLGFEKCRNGFYLDALVIAA